MTSLETKGYGNISSNDLNKYIHSLDKSKNQSYILGKDGELQVSNARGKVSQILSRFLKSKRETPEDVHKITKSLTDAIKQGSNDPHKLDSKSLRIIGNIYLTSNYLRNENKPELSVNLINALVLSGQFKLSDLVRDKDKLDEYIDHLKTSNDRYSLSMSTLKDLHQLAKDMGSSESLKPLVTSLVDRDYLKNNHRENLRKNEIDNMEFSTKFEEFLEATCTNIAKYLASGKNSKKLRQELEELRQINELDDNKTFNLENMISNKINTLPHKTQISIFKKAPTLCKSVNHPIITNALFNRYFFAFSVSDIDTRTKKDFLKPWIKEKALENLNSFYIGILGRNLQLGEFKALVSRLPNVEIIDLGANEYAKGVQTNDELECLALHCKKLKELSLAYQQNIDDDGVIKVLTECKNLEFLELRGADSVKNNDKRLFNALMELENLKRLNFDSNLFTSEEVEALKAKFPNLQIVNESLKI